MVVHVSDVGEHKCFRTVLNEAHAKRGKALARGLECYVGKAYGQIITSRYVCI